MGIDPEYVAFRQRLEARMAALGLSQVALSRLTGVSQGQISRWLRGSWPAAKHLLALARALGWSADQLLGDTTARAGPPRRTRLHPDTVAHAEAIIRKALLDATPGKRSRAPAAARRTKE